MWYDKLSPSGNMVDEYAEMNRLVQNGRIHIFKTGGHPAIMTNAELSAKVITEYLNR